MHEQVCPLISAAARSTAPATAGGLAAHFPRPHCRRTFTFFHAALETFFEATSCRQTDDIDWHRFEKPFAGLGAASAHDQSLASLCSVFACFSALSGGCVGRQPLVHRAVGRFRRRSRSAAAELRRSQSESARPARLNQLVVRSFSNPSQHLHFAAELLSESVGLVFCRIRAQSLPNSVRIQIRPIIAAIRPTIPVQTVASRDKSFAKAPW